MSLADHHTEKIAPNPRRSTGVDLEVAWRKLTCTGTPPKFALLRLDRRDHLDLPAFAELCSGCRSTDVDPEVAKQSDRTADKLGLPRVTRGYSSAQRVLISVSQKNLFYRLDN